MAAKSVSFLRSATSKPAESYNVGWKLAALRRSFDRALFQLGESSGDLTAAAAMLVSTLRSNGRVLVAGNGGSAAEAQHFVAELVGRFKRERPAYAVMSLTADSAVLTAIANDYGYEDVFLRQVTGHGRPGDLLLLFSTSGSSKNLVQAARGARGQAMQVIAITGAHDCPLNRIADLTIHAPADDPAMVQELHMIITHLLCGQVEARLCESSAAAGQSRPDVILGMRTS